MARRVDDDVLGEVRDALDKLERETELLRTVLTVKDPGSNIAAEAFEGLRKQVVAAAAERRSHVNQLVSLAVAIHRATSLDDLGQQVNEWLSQANVQRIDTDAVSTEQYHLIFEDLDGGTLEGAAEIVVLEPAYMDMQTNHVLRLGRARRGTEQQPAGTEGED